MSYLQRTALGLQELHHLQMKGAGCAGSLHSPGEDHSQWPTSMKAQLPSFEAGQKLTYNLVSRAPTGTRLWPELPATVQLCGLLSFPVLSALLNRFHWVALASSVVYTNTRIFASASRRPDLRLPPTNRHISNRAPHTPSWPCDTL